MFFLGNVLNFFYMKINAISFSRDYIPKYNVIRQIQLENDQ